MGRLEDERVSAARISGELAAASEIQLGMLPPRELDRISPAVEIDAVLQSAKTVGGDLYDAFLFGDGRVCFLVGDVTGKGAGLARSWRCQALSRSLPYAADATPLSAAVREINAELSRDNRQAHGRLGAGGRAEPADGRLEFAARATRTRSSTPTGWRARSRSTAAPRSRWRPTFPYPVETHRLARRAADRLHRRPHRGAEPGRPVRLFGGLFD